METAGMSSEAWKRKRTDYEFSKQTKIEALKKADFSCEICGIKKRETKEGYLELHHIVKIAYAARYMPQIAPQVFASIENCQVLCKACHERLHDNENNFTYKLLAQSLLGLIDVKT